MRLAKLFIGLVASGPGWSNYLVTFGFVIRNPIFSTKRRHEHAVNEDNGFGLHIFLL